MAVGAGQPYRRAFGGLSRCLRVDHVSLLELRAWHLMRARVSLTVKHPEPDALLTEPVPKPNRQDKRDHDPKDHNRDYHGPEGQISCRSVNDRVTRDIRSNERVRDRPVSHPGCVLPSGEDPL